MTKRFAGVSADLLLFWICLLVTFHVLPASRPEWWMLIAGTLVRLLVGVSAAHPWRNNALVLVITGLAFHFIWNRAPDVAGLAAWFVLSGSSALLVRTARKYYQLTGRLTQAAQILEARLNALATGPAGTGARAVLLVLAGLWLMHPYLTHGVIGAGDASWYANSIADFLRQTRAGIFPVWLDQTEYSFFGGSFPLRFAPYLQHLCGALDLLTGQSLPSFRILNLALTVSVAGGLISAYLCLAAVLPQRRWIAALLAFLYASCPGVLGLAYGQDLYMSVTALPFLPPAFLGAIRAFEKNDLFPRLLIAGGLAAAWLAHPPIALWSGLVIAGVQVVRTVRQRWNRAAFQLDLLTLGIFALLVSYSFVSVFGLGPRIEAETDRSAAIMFVRQAFPGNWLPLIRTNSLEDLQLGWGLALVFLASLVSFRWQRSPLTLLLAAAAGVLLLLLLPVPGLNSALWHLIPQAVLNITNQWPMQRLFVPLSLCILFCAALILRDQNRSAPEAPYLVGAVLAVAVAWSGFEAGRFIRRADASGQSFAESARWQRTENMAMSRSALGPHLIVPRYFSHGVMDPELENRFLNPVTKALELNNADAVRPGFSAGAKTQAKPLAQALVAQPSANPRLLTLSPAFTLAPHQRYLLAFEFPKASYTGVFILQGEQFYRAYEFPSSGNEFAFGTAPDNSHVLSLWTSLDHPEKVELQFSLTDPKEKPEDYAQFGRVELIPYQSTDLPVQQVSLLSYHARVRTDHPVYLETPRLFMPGYVARVDGKEAPVEESPDGLAAVSLAAGSHEVVLRYAVGWPVRIAFWAGLAFWAGFFALSLRMFLCHRRRLRLAA